MFRLSPPIFSVIRNACLSKSGANIKYASMTHPKGAERTISLCIIFMHPERIDNQINTSITIIFGANTVNGFALQL